jgi:Xaa-Pro aminopeptidase
MYRTVLDSQKKAEEFIRNSGLTIKARDVDKAARDFIISKGFESIPHSLGHGIGIDVHEKPSLSPKSKDTLKSGMVFTIEPGIYVKSFGGIRIEDMYLLKDRALEKITHSTSEIISL